MRWLQLLLRRLQRALPRSEDGVWVLAYHLVGAGTGSPVDVPSSVFRRQMTLLRDTYPVLSLDEVVARLESGDPWSRGPGAVLTFDDAYRNFATHAWPILTELELPATLFVPVGFLDGDVAGPLGGARELPPLSWRELGELATSPRLTIGSHSVTHPDLRSCSGRRLEEEVGEAKRALEGRLGAPVDHFAYPRAQISSAAVATARRHYRSAVVAGGRPVRSSSPLHRLPRLPVKTVPELPISQVLTSPLWLEEWVASLLRNRRPRRGGSPARG